MGRHRIDEGDQTELLPATVEELAAQQSDPARARNLRYAVAVGVAVLLIVGGGWALASGGSSPTPLSLDNSSPRPSASFIDGFGAGTPTPSSTVATGTASVNASVSPSARPSASSTPASPGPSSSPQPGQVTAELATNYWEGGLRVEINIVNNGSQPLVWQLDLELSPRVAVGSPWNAAVADREDDYLRLVAPSSYGPLEPGRSIKVGFVGTWEDTSRKYEIVGCMVNSLACN